MMKKKDFIRTIAKETEMTQVAAEKALTVILSTIESELKAGNDVVLPGFGSFVIKHRAERAGVNPVTLAKITIPAHNVVGFKPGKQLKEAVK